MTARGRGAKRVGRSPKVQSVARAGDESKSLELREFERIEVAKGTALLRVAASSRAGTVPEWRPTLVIDDGVGLHRVLPLPALPDPKGLLRAAYSVPRKTLGRATTTFWLELSDGSTIELPTPTTRRRRAAAAKTEDRAAPATRALSKEQADLREERRRRERAEHRAEALQRVIDDQEQRIDQLQTALRRGAETVTALESRVDELTGELETADAALDRPRYSPPPPPKRAAAEPTPPSSERETPAVERGAGVAHDIFGRLLEAVSVQAGSSADRRRSTVRGVPYETLLGICLLVLGITLAVLILTGAIKLGFAP